MTGGATCSEGEYAFSMTLLYRPNRQCAETHHAHNERLSKSAHKVLLAERFAIFIDFEQK